MTGLSLAACLAQVPDPRQRQGRRHSLGAVLNLVAVGVLCGLRSLQAVVQLGRTLDRATARQLGFTRRPPCKSTLSEVLRLVDPAAFDRQLRAWAAAFGVAAEQWALDGKTARGSADGEVPAVHLLSLYAVAVRATLAQQPVGDKTNEHHAALALLGAVPLAGKLVSGDAMFTHRDFCQAVRDGGGDYLLVVKDNQPTLRRDLQAFFAPTPGLSPPATAVAGRR